MTKTEELLKVLDLPGSQQIEYLDEELKILSPHESLADLAFRLRDEILTPEEGKLGIGKQLDYWWKGMREVAHLRRETDDKMDVWDFWTCNAQPIHWIIASLIAKAEKP